MRDKKFFVLAIASSLVFLLLLSISPLSAGEGQKIKQWINKLSSARERGAAKKHLVDAGKRATPELINALTNEGTSTSVTVLIIQILRADESRESAPLIRKMASSPKSRIRLESIRTLGVMRDEASVDLFKGALRDSNANIRLAALSSLMEIKDKKALPDIISSLSDPSVAVRLKVLEALSLFEDKSIKLALLEQLNDVNANVTIKTVGLLSGYKDKEVVEALLERLDTTNKNLKIKIIEALARIEDESVLPWLEPMLTDESISVRKAAKVTINTIRK